MALVPGHGLPTKKKSATRHAIAEVLNRVIMQAKAWRGCAPAQINVPRDYLDPGNRHRICPQSVRPRTAQQGGSPSA